MTPAHGALAGFAFLLLLLASSMPVGFVMAVVGIAGFGFLVSPQAALSMATIDLYTTFSDYSLTTIPLFILMGQVAFHSGISRGLFARGIPLDRALAGRSGDVHGGSMHGVWSDMRVGSGDVGDHRHRSHARDAPLQI